MINDKVNEAIIKIQEQMIKLLSAENEVFRKEIKILRGVRNGN